MIAERTGTAARPRPDSDANRSPATARPATRPRLRCVRRASPTGAGADRPGAGPGGTRWSRRSPPRTATIASAAESEHRPIEVRRPARDRPRAPVRTACAGRSRSRSATASDVPTSTAPNTPSSPSVEVVARPARQRAKTSSRRRTRLSDREMAWRGDEQRREQGDETEHSERGRLGPDRTLRISFDGRRDVHEQLAVDVRDLAGRDEVARTRARPSTLCSPESAGARHTPRSSSTSRTRVRTREYR